MPEPPPEASVVTVEDCRQAIRLAEWELLRLRAERLAKEATVAEQRRAYRVARRDLARIRRKCRERERQIEVMRGLIRSRADNGLIDVGEAVESAPAGMVLLQRLGEMMARADAGDDAGMQAFFAQLADLQEFAKDFFDYAGVRLVYELGEILDQAAQARPDQLADLFKRVSDLRAEAVSWFERRHV